MKITAIIYSHGDYDNTYKTVNSVKQYITDNILLIVNNNHWNSFKDNYTIPLLKGLNHNSYKTSYRNVLLGFFHAIKAWGYSDWYFYIEDSIVTKPLNIDFDYDIVGSNLREDNKQLKIVEFIIKSPLKVHFMNNIYLYSKRFITNLMETNFIETFLHYTNDFQNGFFPGYGNKYTNFLEHLMPTLANHWGNKIGAIPNSFAFFQEKDNMKVSDFKLRRMFEARNTEFS